MEENNEEVEKVEEKNIVQEEIKKEPELDTEFNAVNASEENIVNVETNPQKNNITNKKKIIISIVIMIVLIVITALFFIIKNNSSKNNFSDTNNMDYSNTDTNTNFSSDTNISNEQESNSNSDEKESNENSNSDEKESNENFNSNVNTYPNIKEEYLDLTTPPTYDLGISYLKHASFDIEFFEGENVQVKLGIENKKAYIYYRDKRIEIKGINNVKSVLADGTLICTGEYALYIFLLTETGEIYEYSAMLTNNLEYFGDYDIPVDITKDSLDFIDNISKDIKKLSLKRKYSDIEFGFIPGGGCGFDGSLIGITSDNKKYFIKEGEKSIEEYGYSAEYPYRYFVDLKGNIYDAVGSFLGRNPKFIFNDISVDGTCYVLSSDLYVYELSLDNSGTAKYSKLKDAKVKKIGIKKVNQKVVFVTIYFSDNSALSFECMSIEYF